MDKLVEKAKSSKWWRWFFAILIALGVAYLAWMVYRKNKELKRLRVDKHLAEEDAKDLASRAEVEENENMAKALEEEAKRSIAKAAELDTRIKGLEAQVAEAKKKVDNAKTWKELEE
jgi:uncharacterized protein HemX